jgi:cytolysin-activating lysine-acyltransferase
MTGKHAARTATAADGKSGNGAAPKIRSVDAGDELRPLGHGPSFGEVIGDITWLLSQSPAHKHLFFADLEWLVIPAVTAKQFRVFKAEARPMAYASWAFLSEEAEARILFGNPRLRPGEWKSGDRAWIIDLVAPFGGREDILKNVKKQHFANVAVKTLRARPDGQGYEAWEIPLD